MEIHFFIDTISVFLAQTCQTKCLKSSIFLHLTIFSNVLFVQVLTTAVIQEIFFTKVHLFLVPTFARNIYLKKKSLFIFFSRKQKKPDTTVM